MQIAIITAVGKNNVIGIDHKLPWDVPEDLLHFKKMTMGHPMIMGRKTFESLPGLLPGRPHWVISRNPEWQAAGARVFASLDAAIAEGEAQSHSQVFIIGGAEVYRQSLGLADSLYLTEVALSPDGDAYFPEFSKEEWKETNREYGLSQTQFEGQYIEYAFVTYLKNKVDFSTSLPIENNSYCASL